MKRILFFSVLMFSSVAFAQAVVPPTYLDGILAWLQTGLGMVVSGVGVLEVILRLFPSVKPLSILIPAKYAVDGIAKILAFVSANVFDPMIAAFNITLPPK